MNIKVNVNFLKEALKWKLYKSLGVAITEKII